VPRRFLRLLAEPDRRPFQKGSGRLEMARAIADPKTPDRAGARQSRLDLALRKGLVGTPSDFGLRSDRRAIPSCSTIWQRIHRVRLVTQDTAPPNHALEHLSQRSEPGPKGCGPTPKTACYGVSIASGSISSRCATRSWPSPACLIRRSAARCLDHRAPVLQAAHDLRIHRPPKPRRTLRTFDFAVPDASSPRRFVTTVPQQALFLMNSPFLHEQTRVLTARSGFRPRGVGRTWIGFAGDPAEGFVRYIAAYWAGRPSPTSSASRSTSFASKPQCRRRNRAPGETHVTRKIISRYHRGSS